MTMRQCSACLPGSFGTRGTRCTPFSRFEEAKAYLSTVKPDVLISDVRLGAFNGLQLVVYAKLEHPDMIAIVLTGFDDPVLRTEAAHAGALYLVKPIESQRLLDLVDGKPDTTSETARNPGRPAWTRPSLH